MVKQVWNFERYGFNDRASSAVVNRGRWEVCENARFQGRCTVLRPGSYESLSGMGMNNRISSVRPVSRNARYENEAPAPLAAPSYEYRRRAGERLYEAPVASVRAMVGPPEQRCWIERQQVVEDRGGANVPGAIVGGTIGGVLGHQIGGGPGRDVATAGGLLPEPRLARTWVVAASLDTTGTFGVARMSRAERGLITGTSPTTSGSSNIVRS